MRAPPATVGSRLQSPFADLPGRATHNAYFTQNGSSPQDSGVPDLTRNTRSNNLLLDPSFGKSSASATRLPSAPAAAQGQGRSRDVSPDSFSELVPGKRDSAVHPAAGSAANSELLGQIQRSPKRPPQSAPSGSQLPEAEAGQQQSRQAGMVADISHGSPQDETPQVLFALQQAGTASDRQNNMGDRVDRTPAAELYSAGADTGLVDSSPGFMPWPTAPAALSGMPEGSAVRPIVNGEEASVVELMLACLHAKMHPKIPTEACLGNMCRVAFQAHA